MESNQSKTMSEVSIVKSGPLFDETISDLQDIYIYPFVLVIFYMVVGILGNSVVIYIFTWQWKPNKTTVFILTLAGVDLISCLFNMPVEAIILWSPLDFDYDVLCKISRFTTYISSASSSFVLIAISVDRYLMVCRPFLGRELGVLYAKRTCIVAVMLGIIATWPSLIFYGTFTFHIDIEKEEAANVSSSNQMQIEGKTCLISNFYVEHYKLPSAFYFFLFGAHAIMFAILAMMYILIGRSLFMSTSTGVSNDKRHSLKYFGLSMMSAITGSLPNTPSVGSRTSRAVSLENINRIDQHTGVHFTGMFPSPRTSADTQVSIIIDRDDDNNTINRNGVDDVHSLNVDAHYAEDKASNNSADQLIDGTFEDNTKCQDSGNLDTLADVGFNQDSEDTTKVDDNKQEARPNKARYHLNFTLDPKINNHLREVQRRNERFPSDSTTSDKCLTPMSAMTPDSVRGIILRSQSIESRARLNRIISDELTHSDVKETSLRRNTLMLRMVTIAFVFSFLPFLIIVTIRYSNTDIPLKLSKAEQIIYHVFLRTYFINSMINPFIYGFMNEEFRSKLKNLFCQMCTRYNINV